jgi:hypothetical protein
MTNVEIVTGLKITYRSSGTMWKGALKNAGGKIVWVCDHHHKNRDNGTWTFGISARGCARNELYRRFKCQGA